MITRNRGIALLSLVAPLLAAGCGAGVAAVAANSGGSGGGTTPALDSFVVVNPKVSPSLLKLDASQPVRVGLFYDLGQGVGERPMTQLTDVAGNEVAGNEVDLPAGEVQLSWNFAAESGGTAKFTRDVHLMAKRGGSVISGGEITLGLGNDAPKVLSIDQIAIDPDEGEASGTTGIELTVADSSDDVVSVKVEFDIQGDVPDAGWQLARPGLVDPGLPTPEFGIANVQVSSGAGTALSFFWDTNAATDLKDLEREVVLRLMPDDGTRDDSGNPIGRGESVESVQFRVDNNAAPIVQLDSGPLILNPDERRGIPIPFRVIDEEGDLVDVIFQWRHEDEQFPSLDTDGNGKIENAEVDAILADPVLRQVHHICTEYPHFAKGRLVPIDDHTVRLPELASSESWILASGIVGKTLELLRPSSIPAPITPTWRSNPLVSPIAALPVGDGLTALVLDVPGTGRLREIELATGDIVHEIATLGPGIPSTMAFERREKAVLVALDDAGTWRIERVEIATGAITELIVSDGTEPAPVRGIASLGTNATVFTAGSSLFHIDYRDPLAPQLGTLLTDLATPWGVVVDPLPPDRIYVSERDANRVLAIDLDSHGKLPVVVKTADLQLGTLEGPEALALERHGSRMLIVTSAPDGDRRLLGLDLGATGENRSFPIGEPTGTNASSVATGSDELRLLCLPISSELFVAGGIEQRRVIAAYSTAAQDASAKSPFDSVPSPYQPWRLSEEAQRLLRASAQGVERRFLWDSTDAQTGSVFVRAMARDNELGLAADGAAPKRVRGRLEVDPVVVASGATAYPRSIAAADLDGDGDQDLVSGNFNSSNLTVFFQISPRIFAGNPLVLGGSLKAPASVNAADLDGDGDQDLVSANEGDQFTGEGGNLTVFSQLSHGSFVAAPLRLGGSGRTDGAFSVVAADLDGDGDQDLVSANSFGGSLTVFFELSPGRFATHPLILSGVAFPLSVATADFDGDGDLDLVSANTGGSELAVFSQDELGSFVTTPLVVGGPATTKAPVSVAAADLDGDGDQDLVSANEGSNNLTIFLQRFSGSFAADPLLLGDLDFPTFVVAADLDGDGDQDLVSANQGAFPSGQGSSLTVFSQLSFGSFAAIPLILGGLETTNTPLSVAAADLDGDGDQDLVSANAINGNLTVFSQDEPGSFVADPLVLGGFPTTKQPTSVAASDLDGDGDQDLVSANANGSRLTVFSQVSPGSFGASPLTLGGLATTNSPVSVAAGDLDSDGDQDLVSAFGNSLTVFFQDLPGSFGATPLTLDGFPTTSEPVFAVTADLDGDGDRDIVSANSNSNNLSVFLQLSPGSFAASPLVLGGPATTSGPVSVAAADLDWDGDLDLVSANDLGNNLTVFMQLSSGSFAASPLVLGGPETTNVPSSVAAADFDSDGDLDLVSANVGLYTLTVFFQLSPGSFGAAPLVLGGFPTTKQPTSVAAADFDGDGDQDLVSANNLGNNLTVFLQLSPGRFGATPVVLGGVTTTNAPFSVAAVDLDGDGDQDLVSANKGDSFTALGSNLTVFFGGR